MKAKQLELLLPHSFTHRYQVLDALSDAEEARLGLTTPSSTSTASATPLHTKVSDGYAHHYGLPSGNPYSRVAEENKPNNSSIPLSPSTRISARAFEREATRILRQYSPTVGKRRKLRPEFRSFVSSHVSKPPAGRAQILAELQKYDLSASGFAEPLFNREMSDRMLKKLLRIGNQ
jgi:hypothetical protein